MHAWLRVKFTRFNSKELVVHRSTTPWRKYLELRDGFVITIISQRHVWEASHNCDTSKTGGAPKRQPSSMVGDSGEGSLLGWRWKHTKRLLCLDILSCSTSSQFTVLSRVHQYQARLTSTRYLSRTRRLSRTSNWTMPLLSKRVI